LNGDAARVNHWLGQDFAGTSARTAPAVTRARCYTRAKVVTSRWGLPAGGVQLGFPQNT